MKRLPLLVLVAAAFVAGFLAHQIQLPTAQAEVNREHTIPATWGSLKSTQAGPDSSVWLVFEDDLATLRVVRISSDASGSYKGLIATLKRTR